MKEETKENIVDVRTHFRYCEKCGSQKRDVECDYYDTFTGKKVHDLVCPKVGCERNCDFWGHEYKRRWWFASDVKCVKCGYIPRDY